MERCHDIVHHPLAVGEKRNMTAQKCIFLFPSSENPTIAGIE
jgi:hypothetical protein